MAKPRLALSTAVLLVASVLGAAQSDPKVVVARLSPEEIAELQAVAPEAELVSVQSAQEALDAIADADALLGVLNQDLVRAGKQLKWIQVYSAGVDPYRYPELINSGIVLTNFKIFQGPNIADHAFALLLPLTRRITETLRDQEREEWSRRYRRPEDHPIELHGKTALVIGMGGIGTQIAQRAHAFGMRVIGIDPKDIPMMFFVEATYHPDQLDKWIPEADVVFMAAPHTTESERMMGADQFGSMKRGSYFIGVSRGKTYDMDALVKALDERRLAGAGVDVTDPEPLPKGHPLWKFDNVLITPHIAGQSDNILDRRFVLIKENLRRFTTGAPLLNVVDKQKGY